MGNICLVCFLWLLRETQCKYFCRKESQTSVNVCTNDTEVESKYILIDTEKVPDFQQSSCECVLSTNKEEPLDLRMNLLYYITSFDMKFAIEDAVVNKFNLSSDISITGSKKLSFSNNINHQRDGACLGIYSKSNGKFNITCTQLRREATIESVSVSSRHENNTTEFSTFSQLQITNHTSTYDESRDQDVIKSQKGSFCLRHYPIVKICTDQEEITDRNIFIDTASVPKFQQTSCECTITPLEQHLTLILNLIRKSGKQNMIFELNDIEIGNLTDHGETQIRGKTKLLFSTTEKHERDGVCLAVYSEDGKDFKISCSRSTRETTSKSSTTANSKDSQTSGNAIIIPVVSATFGVLCGIAVAVACAICLRRRKRGVRRSFETAGGNSANAESDYYMTENPMYNASKVCYGVKRDKNKNNGGCSESYAGFSPSSYDCIDDLPDRKNSSKEQTNKALTYDYATCLAAEEIDTGCSNAKMSVPHKVDQPKCSRIKANDDTVYDSTKVTRPQKNFGDNDYDHLGSDGLVAKSLTYDTIVNTTKIKLEKEC